jgi:uncharacterized protein YjbI with pentapeptide repeats
MNQWSISSTREYDGSYAKFKSEIGLLKEEFNVDIDKLPVQLIAEINNLKEKGRIKSQASRQFSEIAIHEEIIASFIKSLLNNSDKNPIENLDFFQNSLNYQAIINAKLVNPSITNSAISSATMSRFNLVGITKCLIENSTFEFSKILDSSFTNCEIKQTLFSGRSTEVKNVSFKDSSFDTVFFYYADISGSDFRGVKGLKPEYFYAAVNYHKAKFSDANFIDEITKVNETLDNFIDFLNKTALSIEITQSICKDIFEANELICPLY